MQRLKLEQLGDEIVIALPTNLLEEFGLKLGDSMPDIENRRRLPSSRLH